MEVKELMSRAVRTIESKDTVAQAIAIMREANIRHLAVVEDQLLVGVLSERDVLALQVDRPEEATSLPISEVMSSPPQTIHPNNSTEVARERMARRRIGCLPVLLGQSLVGMLTRSDLLGAPGEHSPPRRRLFSLTARDLMTINPITVDPEAPLLEAIERMSSAQIRHLPVITKDRKVLGMLSDRVMRSFGWPALGEEQAPLQLRLLKVSAAIKEAPRTVPLDTALAQLAHQLVAWGVGAVAIVDEQDQLAGMVSYIDILRALGEAG